MSIERESPPPSRWGKSKTGTYFYVIHTANRNRHGVKQYRLQYCDVKGKTLWTLEELNAEGIRWLKNQPSAFSRSGGS